MWAEKWWWPSSPGRQGTSALIACLWLLPGCAETEFSAQIVPYNHTTADIGAVYVNGRWGGNSFAHSGGGSFVCCVTLPVRPPEGYTVKVGWEDGAGQQHERDVVLPSFASPGNLMVHFLRKDQIKVFVSNVYLLYPAYPLKGEVATLREGVPNPQPNYGK